jgi:hypothetical protein
VDVALMGGIIDNDTMLARLLKDVIKKNKSLNLIDPKGNALQGSLILAEKMIQNDIKNG